MPEVQGELVNLSNETPWTRGRINNLENVACERERDAGAGARKDPIRRTHFDRDSRPFETDAPFQPGWAVPEHHHDSVPFGVPISKRGSFNRSDRGWGQQLSAGGADAWAKVARSDDGGAWPEAPPTQRSYRTPSRQGSTWGGDYRATYARSAVSSTNISSSARWSDHPAFGWGGAFSEPEIEARLNSPLPFHEPVQDSDSGRLWTTYDGDGPTSPNGNVMWNNTGSNDGWTDCDSSRTRTPTVQTIEDDDTASNASAAHKGGESWGKVVSRPQYVSTPAARHLFQVPQTSARYRDGWPKSTFSDVETRNGGSRATSRSPDFAYGWDARPLASRSRDAGGSGGWAAGQSVTSASVHGSHGGWRRSTSRGGWGSQQTKARRDDLGAAAAWD